MTLNESSLEKKFESVSNSQDSIQTLSLWILHHKKDHKRIVQIWMKCFEKAKPCHRLVLFYLANDVIQHAKRKGIPQYLDDFAEYLRDSTTLMKTEAKNMNAVDRVFTIWKERSVYSSDFIEELKSILSGDNSRASAASKIVAEFKLNELIDKMKKMKKVENSCMSKMDLLLNCKVDATSCEVLNKLKDKTHGEQFSKDFDDATKCLETVISALEKEVNMRTDIVTNLEKSEIFYDTQRDEARIVANAYKNFGLRVKNVKKKIEETKGSLPSPLPSPPRDAPSPTNSDNGLELPPNASNSNVFNAQVNALISIAREKAQQHESSLDQRLSNLMMQNIPQMSNNDPTASTNNYNMANTQSLQQQPQQQIQQHNEMSMNQWNRYNPVQHQQSQNVSSVASNYVPHHENSYNTHGISNETMSYNYSYPQQNIQTIQSVVSTRNEDSSSLPTIMSLNQFNQHQHTQQAPENLEPADMDLGNSDEEDGSALRLQHQAMQQQQHRTLKVIETHDHQQGMQSKMNNGNNFDHRSTSYNHNVMQSSFPSSSTPFISTPTQHQHQLKSIARMPVQHSPLNSKPPFGSAPGHQTWRGHGHVQGPRMMSSVVSTPHSQYSSNTSINESYSPNRNNNSNRRNSNRNHNQRRGSYRR